MNANLPTVAAWSDGLAGTCYAVYALYLGFAWRGGVRGLALAVAVGLTAVWSFIAVAFAATQATALYEAGALADVLRMGAWFCFLLLWP